MEKKNHLSVSVWSQLYSFQLAEEIPKQYTKNREDT